MANWTGPDSDGDYSMFVGGKYIILLFKRIESKDLTWRFGFGDPYKQFSTGTTDIEEAKAIALTLWSFNK